MATATYIDEDGTKQTGTVATPETPEPTEPTYYEKVAQSYADMYNQQLQNNKAQIELQNQMTAQQAQANAEKQAQEYLNVNRQLYRDYESALRNLPQQLAAMGATGGLSETSRIRLDTGYGENLGANERARIAGEAEIARAAELARQQNALQQMQADNNAYAAYMSAIMGNEQMKYNEEQQKLTQGAEARASVGDYGGYVELGLLTEEQAELLKNAWIAENKDLAKQLGYIKSGGGGGGGGGELSDRANALIDAALERELKEDGGALDYMNEQVMHRGSQEGFDAWKEAVEYLQSEGVIK